MLGAAAPASPSATEPSARMISRARGFIKNDLIVRDLKVETLEKFIKMLARHTFNRADASPYASLHNLAPQCEQPPGDYLLPRDMLPFFPNEDKI
ncbi:hypothetical protein EVAR_19492_1 [Eumeta japonica]|uniref:Uncharacterized protein n=1 Tax=Eumeta variegata TaxID=151549 RepID=A0A4C1V8T5_EUMVA|nr:hypothetical protein EVAR_19492_1 [Eumeta japonica]